MIGLDSNILLQLAFAEHSANQKTIVSLEERMRAGLYAHNVTQLMTANPADFKIFDAFELITP